MKTDWYKTIKIILSVIALVLFFFYAQNNRYCIKDSGIIFDKWFCTYTGINE